MRIFHLKYLSIIVLLFAVCATADGQKLGYIDANYILNQMPAKDEAAQEMNALSTKWQGEIQGMKGEITKMNLDYKAEEVLLTDEMKKERKEAITKKENELMQLQSKYFGPGGLTFLKRQELMKPLQDEVFEAVSKVCREERIAIMFDKSAELTMIYTDPRHDYTEKVLDALGLLQNNDKFDAAGKSQKR